MKFNSAAAAAVMACFSLCLLAACDGPPTAEPQTRAEANLEQADSHEQPAVGEAAAPFAPASARSASSVQAEPTFAALFPGAELDRPAVAAMGPAGPGGMVTFLTDASPEAIVTFYQDRSAEADLSPVMSMSQGEARAFGAAHAARGASLQVVAAPVEDGRTSVQLSWSAGQAAGGR